MTTGTMRDGYGQVFDYYLDLERRLSGDDLSVLSGDLSV